MQVVDGWVNTAIEVDVLENSMSRNGYKPTHIVLHSTAGGASAENIGAYFQSTVGGSNPVSSHFIIGQDGHIIQCISCDMAAWANGSLNKPRFAFPANVNPNLYTISIEHVKSSTDNSDALTDAQAQASFQLIQLLCQYYEIPMRAGDASGGVVSHADLDSVNRARCPGPYPWDALWAFLKGGSMNVPTGWTYDSVNHILKSPTGVPVRAGFADHILNDPNWDPADVPLGPEYAINPVEDYWTNVPPDGTRQDFNYTVLGWTQKRLVWKIGAGHELKACRADRDKAKADLANAQKAIAALQQQVQLLQSGSPLADYRTRLQQINSLSSI